jgi:hypothetical protein
MRYPALESAVGPRSELLGTRCVQQMITISDNKIADYTLGYASGPDGKEPDGTKSEARQIGLAEAQE